MATIAFQERVEERFHGSPHVRMVEDTARGPMMISFGSELITGEGLQRAVVWSRVRGATAALLAGPSVVTISPGIFTESLPSLVIQIEKFDRARALVIANSQRKPIRSLRLEGLRKEGEDNPVYSSRDDLESKRTDSNQTLRLVVSTRETSNQEWIPLFSIPEVSRRRMVPSMLGGARFEGRVLTFPRVLAGQIRLSLVEGDVPEDFRPVHTQATRIKGTAEHEPTDLELLGPAGQSLWAMPGRFPLLSPAAEADVTVPLGAALSEDIPAAGAENRSLHAELTLSGGENSSVYFSLSGVRGHLVREHPELRVVLTGEPAQLQLGEPLDDEAPTAVTAGLFVRYDGIRVVSALSDPLPEEGGPASGIVVGSAPAYRPLPSALFAEGSLARVGLIGRAPELAELEIQVVHWHGGRPGEPTAAATFQTLDASSAVGTAWHELGAVEAPPGPVALAVRAVRGRFYWIATEQPHVRLAVHDAEPPAIPLWLDGHRLADVGAGGLESRGHSLPASPFADPMPLLRSDLFLTVDLADLVLRYAR